MNKQVTISKIYNNEIRFITKREINSKLYLEKEEVPDFHRYTRCEEDINNVVFTSNPDEKCAPTSVNVKNGTKTLYKISNERFFSIDLNPSNTEPLVRIQINEKNYAALLDSGSVVNAISENAVGDLNLQDEIRECRLQCVGPSGEKLPNGGIVSITFRLGGILMTEDFVILKLHQTALILGYTFGKKHGLKLYYGSHLTNDPEYKKEPLEGIESIHNFRALQIKPIQDHEIIPYQTNFVTVKTYDCPSYMYDAYKYGPWVVKLTSGHQEVSLMDHRGFIKISVPSRYPYVYTEESSSMNYGVAAPLQVVNCLKSRRITPLDIISPYDYENDNLEIRHEGFSLNDVSHSEISPVGKKYLSMEPLGTNINAENVPSDPCKSCVSQGNKFYCLLDKNCINKFEIAINAPKILIHHKHRCFANFMLTHDKCVRIECTDHTQLDKALFVGDPAIIKLEINDFYVSENNNNFTIVARSAPSDGQQKLFKGLQKFIKDNKIENIFLNCQCIYNLSNIKNMLPIQVSIHLTSNKCNVTDCNMTETSLRPISKYIAQDKSANEAEILTDNPLLIKEYAEIIDKHEALFSVDAFDIGQYCDEKGNIVIFDYRTIPGIQPFIAKFIPISSIKKQAATEIIDKLLKKQIIVRQVSPWCSNAVWTSKAKVAMTKKEAEQRGVSYIPLQTNDTANVSLRLAVNYKAVNNSLIYPASPLPNIKKVFSQLKNADTITVIDLTQSYYSLTLSEDSSRLTNFWSGISSDFSLSFTRAAMGIKSSGSLLNAAVAQCLSPIRNNLITYSDNIIIYSQSKEHPGLVNECFSLLKKHNLKIKKSKAVIHCNQPIRILGVIYDVQNKILLPDKEKIRALIELPVPNTLTSLKSFLGSVQFLIEFMVGAADHLATLYNATKKRHQVCQFSLSETEIKAFNELKKIMIAPNNFIYFINYELPIQIKIDSSTKAVGFCVLQQIPEINKTVSCGYYSKIFSNSQQRYAPSERELLGVTVALKSLENVIMGGNIIVTTDCRAILAMVKHSSSNSKFARYASYIESFEPPITFQWVSARSPAFKIADLLSRSNLDCQNEVINTNFTPQHEAEIDKMAAKIKGGLYKPPEYKLLMDFIIKKSLDDLQKLPDSSIFIDQHGNICSQSGEEKIILRENKVDTSHSNSPPPQPITPKDAKEQSISIITSNTLMEDVKSLNQNNKFTENFDMTNKEDLFLNFIITKYPLIDMVKLRKLQQTDPGLKSIILDCEKLPNQMTYRKQKFFKLRHSILIMGNKQDYETTGFKICIPTCLIIDMLIALHRNILNSHPGVKRLIGIFEENFFGFKVKMYAMQVVHNCFVCVMNSRKPNIRKTDYPHKLKLSVEKPGVLWFADVIQIVNDTDALYDSAVCFADGVSGFLAASPIKKPLNNEIFIEIFREKVLAYFPNTRFLVTDNSPDISSKVTKQMLHNLNVLQCNTRPYMAKSNYAELLQKFLLRSLRLNTQELGVPPSKWHILLTPALITINNSKYENLEFTFSPQQIMTGQKSNLSTTFQLINPDLLSEADYEPYVCKLTKNLAAATLIITELKRRKVENNLKSQQKYTNKAILPGDLVTKVDHRQNVTGFNMKLRPRYRQLFIVLATTNSSAYIKPYTKNSKKDELTFEEFIKSPPGKNNKPLETFRLEQVDMSDLKKIKTVITCNVGTELFMQDTKLTFPGTQEVDIEDSEQMSIIQSTELSGYISKDNDDANSYEKDNLSHEIVSVEKINTNYKVQFRETVEAISDTGRVKIEKLNSKYSLKAPSFGSCF